MYNNLVLNRITCPNMNLEDFIKNASKWGFNGIEIRNDLNSGEIIDGLDPIAVTDLAKKGSISIVSINALQRFNDGNPSSHIEELEELLKLASTLGKTAIVLCPVNDAKDLRTKEECLEHTIEALKAYAPYFTKYNLTGLIEPLGFEISSLRTKEMASKAIIKAEGKNLYKILHDTFHHFLSNEKEFFPEMTGLVHISGVERLADKNPITDEDRVLIGDKDTMSNREQINTLLEGGYKGVIAIEAFSSQIQKLSADDLEVELKNSLNYIFN